jgi:hypothetical protein
MFKSRFIKVYLAAGLAAVAFGGVADATGLLLQPFGPRGDIDTSSRAGYWTTWRKPRYDSSGTGRSPGTSGGYSSGGYSGGK